MAYSATTALPHKHLDRATAGLRAQLRYQLLADGVAEPPNWRHLSVTGPLERPDSHGRTWYFYLATLTVAPSRSHKEAAESRSDNDTGRRLNQELQGGPPASVR
jgi:hypothetical protein